MKHFLLLPFFALCFSSNLRAQTVPGPVEQQVTNNICDCITKLDMEKIQDKARAEKEFMNCFANQTNLIVQLAEERHVDITDQPAMANLGTDVAKNLMKQDCKGFMQLSMVMAGNFNAEANSGVTEGQLKRIETKDFSYFVLTDSENKERSFIWLRQFPGSDNFMTHAAEYVGHKLGIEWQDIEVYVPAAKNYYTIKEIVKLEVL